MNIDLAIPILASLLAACAVLAAWAALARPGARRRRLAELGRRTATGTTDARRAARSGFEDPGMARAAGRTAARAALALGRKVVPKDRDELGKGQLALVRAGLPGSNALMVYWGVKCAMALAGILASAGLNFLAPDSMPLTMLAVLAASSALIGFHLPGFWLSRRISARRTRILHALPDALDLLVVCVEAGMGLDQALERVGREITLKSPDLSGELNTLNLELRAGTPRQDAMRNLALRVDLEDVTSLTTLINQADSFGTSVARTLRIYSDTLRTKRRQRAEEMAAKMPVKLLFPLVLFILPALFVVIIGPAAIQLAGVFAQLPS